MKLQIPAGLIKWTAITAIAAGVVTATVTRKSWLPVATTWADNAVSSFRPDTDDHDDDGHDDHDHDDHEHEHEGHAEESSIELSAQALRNIGLPPDLIQPVKLQSFRRSLTIPARVVERPGRSRVGVATPMTGVVTHVHAVDGEAVEAGTLLFKIRLTHEDLVTAQTEFVRTMGELQVEAQEIARLKRVTRSGAVPGKLLLEREYARNKLTAILNAQRESLKLHGLSEEQVAKIEKDGQLLRELQIFAPAVDRNSISSIKTASRSPDSKFSTVSVSSSATPMIVQDLQVHKGQSVHAGDTLCMLADYSELFIEGLAFAQDIQELRNASENDWSIDAVLQQSDTSDNFITNLKFAYLANKVDTESRSLHFYVRLPNDITKRRNEGASRYIEWKHLPGQRLQLKIPVEEWAEQIVLPVTAIAREAAESFVFRQNGDHFDRVAIHVKYRDQFSVVVENDGSLFPGDVVALRGAHQMMMALKNQSGGAIDPHAGHSH
ncbi:MAG: efflux RND transporter periplasmic adaptor subunit [Planctomycetaceae bacterium]